jgi:hypothetical protein
MGRRPLFDSRRSSLVLASAISRRDRLDLVESRESVVEAKTAVRGEKAFANS